MVGLTVAEFGLPGRSINDELIKQFTWTTDTGFSLTAISYGAIVQSIKVPDKHGIVADVVLGFDDLDSYVNRNLTYFGAAVGRCANRIAGAGFEIDGVKYQLSNNIGMNHLHGGNVGFDKVNWITLVEDKKVVLSYLSKNGEEGYPGDLIINITYEVKNDDSFHVEFLATTTKKTVVNLTNHSYFNLAGHDGGVDELYDHLISINADRITETLDGIPTGRLLNVGGTPFDLRVATRLGDAINKRDNLFDDNFCISNYENKDLAFVSRVSHPSSGRYLEVYSNQPGVQFYTSNGFPSPTESALVGKGGVGYRRHGAFCLETQNYPDAVHHDNFPKSLLSPGQVYRHRVVYKFGAKKEDEPVVVTS